MAAAERLYGRQAAPPPRPGSWLLRGGGVVSASLIFAQAAGWFNGFRLVGVGMVCWAAGSVLTGAAASFGMLAVARTVVGCGEAPLLTITFTFLDDVAPPARKTLWFGVLGLFPVLGSAAGYVLADPLTAALGWRGTFYLQLQLQQQQHAAGPDATSYGSMPYPPAEGGGAYGDAPYDAPEGGPHGGGGGAAAPSAVQQQQRRRHAAGALAGLRRTGRDVAQLFRYPACCLNNFGYAPVQWIIGMVSFWGPKAIKEMFSLQGSGPELVIGAIVVVTGIVGTLAGGWALDVWGSSLRNGFSLQAASVAAALLFLQLAFLGATSYPAFCVLLSLGLLSIFFSQASSYALSMWTVPPPYRPLSQAAIILLQHLLGDVPSPPVAGAIHDATHSWRRSLAAASSYLAVAVVLFTAGALLAASGRARDFREEGDAAPSAEGGGLAGDAERWRQQDSSGGVSGAQGAEGGRVAPGGGARGASDAVV
ncbi:putative sphingolipid transporter spinster 1 [Tetrabaena socialis]|uniref:Putative sphingolipid transporter spinster 1 n=1 Tax=Tetrabaena socialis TaxID=47790 RepID=A0A2J8A579_9CHLO|nr:putative sphingolipid transporter spinster 1 [Tetrabaena socialis]|eukprot:PNH07653.1 putative sphingolipid transporter spinster 1 [Tetrabaena socialis]